MTMAAAQVGVKRSIDQVDGSDSSLLNSTPQHSRRASPPTRRPSLDHVNTTKSQSGYATPSRIGHHFPRAVTFAPDASIVLVGVRGVGKSSLGVLAATAYNRRLVESERVFLDATGITNQAYRKLHGAVDYQQRHLELMRRMLDAHEKNAVIVCSFTDLEGPGSSLIAEYAQRHPVVYITRELQSVQAQMRVWDADRVAQLLAASDPILRSCSNYEFFNLSEKIQEDVDRDVQDVSPKSPSGFFLTLKRVEEDFLKMLRNIIGDHEREQSHHSMYPLSRFQVHQRSFTIMASISVAEVLDSSTNLDELQDGVDAVEMCIPLQDSTVDFFARAGNAFALLRRVTILPIVLSVTFPEGLDSISKSDRQRQVEAISFCFRLAPEYCTVDLSLDEPRLALLLATKGRTTVIGQRAFVERPSGGWTDLQVSKTYLMSTRFGFDICRITMPARSMQDNFAVQTFRQIKRSSATGPITICYNTGRYGKHSMCFNPIMTPVCSAQQRRNNDVDRGNAQVTAKDIYTSLFASFVYDPMHFFIYGASVGYSLSPAMHNSAYAAIGMPHHYDTQSYPDLDVFRILTRKHDFGGCAVVQPFKVEVMPLLDGLSDHARIIGSVNTIMPVRELDDNGSLPSEFDLIQSLNRYGPVRALYGENTDWVGIFACLRRGLSPANTIRPNSTALVCGAGGQARATIYAMLSLGVRNIFIANRTLANAQQVADHYNTLIKDGAIRGLDPGAAAHTHVRVLGSLTTPWPADRHRYPTLIVSSIPTQRGDGSLIDFALQEDWLRSPTGGVVCELAYRPMITPVVRQMSAFAPRGWILMDGLDVLPEQAFAQFEFFTGRRAPRRLMRDQVIRHYRAEQERLELRGTNLDPNPPGA